MSQLSISRLLYLSIYLSIAIPENVRKYIFFPSHVDFKIYSGSFPRLRSPPVWFKKRRLHKNRDNCKSEWVQGQVCLDDKYPFSLQISNLNVKIHESWFLHFHNTFIYHWFYFESPFSIPIFLLKCPFMNLTLKISCTSEKTVDAEEDNRKHYWRIFSVSTIQF